MKTASSCRRPTGTAVESLSPAKRERLTLLAEAYGAEHPELPRDYRIDLLAIDLAVDGSVAAVRHLRNALEG
jgi:Holliday junction resolvase-like predicted endonuclease